MTLCEACRINTATEHAYLCQACQTDLLALFARLPADINAMQALADKTARIGNREHSGRSPFPASPVNWDADTHLHNLKTWLQVTDSDLQARRGLTGPEKWLWHWNNINADRNEWLPLASTPARFDQLKQLTRKTSRLLSPPGEYQFAGTCTNCGQPIYAPPNRSEAYCRCGNIINIQINRAKAQEQLRRMVVTTTPDGAAQWVKDNTGLTITRKDVNNWRRRGKLHARPTEDDGYWEYPVSELTELAEEKHKRQ